MNTSPEPTRDHTITEESTVADAEQQETPASTQEFTVVEAKATRALFNAGVANAELFVREAVTMSRQAEYNPHQQTSCMLAALGTLIALHTREWPRLGGEGFAALGISLARLSRDVVHDVQIRVEGIDPDIMDDYARAMQAGDEFPPVIVFWDKMTNRVYLADGFHRYMAAKSLPELHTIPAEVYAGTQQDALEYAATCNATHGIPMTSADKRAAVGRLLRMHPDWSNREIGRKVGCGHSTVDTLRKEYDLSAQNGQIETKRTVTRGDSTYIYTPPAPPEQAEQPIVYATQEELEIQVRDYLDCCGDREPGKQLTKSELDTDIIFLESLISNDYHVPEDMKMPEYYRRVDWVNAVLTVASEWRPMRWMLLNADEDDEQEPPATVTYATLSELTRAFEEYVDSLYGTRGSRDNNLRERVAFLDDIVANDYQMPASFAFRTTWLQSTWIGAVDNLLFKYRSQLAAEEAQQQQDPLEPWQKIKRLLIDGDHDQLRTVLSTGAPIRDRGIHIAQTLIDAIFLPWPEDAPEATLPSAEASGNPTCPDCGGDIEAKESNGDYIPVCSDCGSVIGPVA